MPSASARVLCSSRRTQALTVKVTHPHRLDEVSRVLEEHDARVQIAVIVGREVGVVQRAGLRNLLSAGRGVEVEGIFPDFGRPRDAARIPTRRASVLVVLVGHGAGKAPCVLQKVNKTARGLVRAGGERGLSARVDGVVERSDRVHDRAHLGHRLHRLARIVGVVDDAVDGDLWHAVLVVMNGVGRRGRVLTVLSYWTEAKSAGFTSLPRTMLSVYVVDRWPMRLLFS